MFAHAYFVLFCLCFFFKQKTAYEMRISDWSSDVCSSDLIHDLLPAGNDGRRWRAVLNEAQIVLHNHPVNAERVRSGRMPVNSLWFHGGGRLPDQVACDVQTVYSNDFSLRRSEEHTSELQSLMRISYAVFCLKKKNTNISD